MQAHSLRPLAGGLGSACPAAGPAELPGAETRWCFGPNAAFCSTQSTHPHVAASGEVEGGQRQHGAVDQHLDGPQQGGDGSQVVDEEEGVGQALPRQRQLQKVCRGQRSRQAPAQVVPLGVVLGGGAAARPRARSGRARWAAAAQQLLPGNCFRRQQRRGRRTSARGAQPSTPGAHSQGGGCSSGHQQGPAVELHQLAVLVVKRVGRAAKQGLGGLQASMGNRCMR